jgi:hypothetical protein
MPPDSIDTDAPRAATASETALFRSRIATVSCSLVRAQSTRAAVMIDADDHFAVQQTIEKPLLKGHWRSARLICIGAAGFHSRGRCGPSMHASPNAREETCVSSF